MKTASLILGLTLAFSLNSFGAEPSYCNPSTFLKKEIKHGNSKLVRGRLFQLGEAKVMGVAVGDSAAKDLVSFARSQSTAEASDKFCTWYYNEGDKEAEAWFTHRYVPNPLWLSASSAAKKYNSVLKDEFANSLPSFLSCARDHKYIAMGCNGQKHRGPSVFGMMLAFSGCSPQNAATIVNTVWGLNGVSADVRLSIINEGKKLGDADPEGRAQLQHAFGVN